MERKLISNIREIFKEYTDADYLKAFLVGFAMLIPILAGIAFNKVYIGIAVTTGVFLVVPGDVSGNLRWRLLGIFLSALLAVSVLLIGSYLRDFPIIFFPVLGILTFCISYLSLYGFRASLIVFTGLLALTLSLSNLISDDFVKWHQALWIFSGSLWYFLLVFLFHVILPKGEIELHLSQTFRLTSNFLNTRAKLLSKDANRNELNKEILRLQGALTEEHEALRDLLISRRRRFGRSDYFLRRLTVLGMLIDILELAVANPVNFKKMNHLFLEIPKAEADFKNLINEISHQLIILTKYHSKPKKITPNPKIEFLIQKIHQKIDLKLKENNTTAIEDGIILKNYIKYLQDQYDKVKKIEQILKGYGNEELKKIRKAELGGFISRNNYNFNILAENFHSNSTILRHSLRITLIMMIGYLVGLWVDAPNVYWILITIIVIMRPNYGLTKQRSQQRTVGTALGAVIALGLVFLIKNQTVFGILGLLSLVFALPMIKRNYRNAAIFITMSVIFIYALLEPNVFNVIQSRVLYTFIGAGLAVAGNILLWPAWEIKNINNTLKDTLIANRQYFKEVITYYKTGGIPENSYKLARKKAFLELSELHSSFQRMTQEPKSKHKNLDEIYKITSLNHSFLVSTASLGTYFINHPTTPASRNFIKAVGYIEKNMELSILSLSKESGAIKELVKPEEVLKSTFGITEFLPQDSAIVFKYEDFVEEAHLVMEQLRWLLEISEKILLLIENLTFEGYNR